MAEIIEDTMQQGEQVQQGEPKPAIKKSNAIELHKALKSQGFTDANLGGDEATFAKLMQNKENATSLHKALRAQGFTDVNLGGDETQFYSLMSEKKNLGEPTGKPSAPTPSQLPLKEEKESAPKGFPLAKVNYNIISQLANTPAKKPEDWTKMAQDKVISDNTRLPKVDERVAGAMGHSSIDRAADNATERALKAKGIVTPKYSAVYNQEKQRIKNNINNGDASVVVHFGKDDKGKPTQELGVSRNIGFIESLGKNFDKAIKGNEEADQFANKMTTDEKIKYIDDKQNEKKKLDEGGYISEQNTQLGEAGKFIGENALFPGKAIVGGLAGAAIVAAAPESLGASLVGLPAVMSFVFTGQDAVNQGIFNEVTNRYNKNLAAGMDKYSAMKEAEKGGVIGGVLGGLENVALTGGGLKPFSNAAKSTLEKVAKETLTSSVNLGAVSGAKTLTEKGIQAAQGYHVTPKEVVEETAQAIAGGMTVGGALHILSAGASNLLNVPKLFKNTLVDGLSQESPEAINTVLDANEKLGNITPEVKNKIVSDIDSHREAKTKVADGLTPESQSSIAGLIQLKDKLTEEAKTKDPTQVDVYNQRIKAIDEQIKNITNTNEPLKYEVDEATGRPYQNEGDLALGDIVRTKEGKLGKIEKIEGDNVTISDPKEPSKTTEINKGEVDLGPAITGIEEKETIKQMLPITDEMVNIEREFQNNGYTIETDYDNEIQIRDKNDEQVGPEELPDNLKKMAADYEKATGKLGEFDAVAREKALTQSRQVEEVTAEEVKPQENVKPIRQLGTGANVYFETDKHRVNDDLKSGKVLLNVGSKESEVPMANIKFDNAAEAVAVAKELDRIYPKGVPNAVLIDKVVENIKKEQSLSKEQTQEGSGVGGDVDRIENEEKRKEIKGYDKLKEVEKNGGYIKTDETITDNDYEPTDIEHKRTKAYKVEYAVKWSDNETSSNPDIKTFSTIDEAHKAAQTEGDWWNGGIDHLQRIEPVYKEVWLNKDGTEFEETGKTLNGDEFAETKEGKDFIKDFGFSKWDNSSEVYIKDFGKRDDNSRQLESETYHSLGSDLETTFKNDNGETYTIKHDGKGKYSSLRILDKEGDEIDRVQLRIADHTYNPRNNDDAAREGKFISVEIANVNATKDKFRTSYSLQFDGTDSYADILTAVKERLNDILDNKIEYPKAVEQSLPTQAAKKAFSIDNKEDFYHGSFNKREGELRTNTAEQFGDAIYFTTSKEEAEGNYPNVTKVKLNIENPIYAGEGKWNEVERLALEKENANKERDEDGKIINEARDYNDIKNTKNISDAAKELGYDAIILRGEGNHQNETAVLDPSKIIYSKEIEKVGGSGVAKKVADGQYDFESEMMGDKGPSEKSVEETAVSKKEFEKPTKEKPFVTKNKRQIVIINDKSGLAEVFSNEGKKVTRQTEKKALREYARSIDFTKGKTAEEKAEESGKEISSNDDFVEKSENPYELANFFVNQEPTTFNLTTTEAMIADFGVGLTTNKSFKSFSDKNYITLGIAKRYLNNTKGTPLDVMAHEMSYHYFPEGEGTEISPEDIASFMIRFPNSSNAEKLMESEDAVMAADKFEKLTGLMLNRDIANVVIDQEFQRKAEEQKAIKQIVEKEYASQAELEEEYNRLYSETNGFEPGDYKLSDGTDVTVNEDGTIKSEKYEPPTKTNYFTKESIVSKTSKGIEEKKAKPTKEAKIEEFEKKLDEKAEALKNLLIPKHLREISKKGLGIEELIDRAVKIIKDANIAKTSIEEAIEKAVIFIKDGWNKSWGDFNEGSVRDVLATEKGETIRGITIKENKERRAELGMPERQPNPESFEKWDNEAKKLIDNGYDMEPLIQKMERGEATTPVESSIRKIYAATIDAELRNNPTQKTLQKAKRFVKASDLASSQAGKNLASLKRNAEPMSSITDFYVSKMEANGTDTLTKEQIEEVKKSFAKFEEKISTYNEIFDKATKKIAELEAENELLKTRKEIIGGKAKEGNVYKNGKRDYVAERQQYKDKLKETYQKYIESINKLGIVSDGGVEGFALTIDMAKLIMEIVKSHVEEVGAKLSEVTKRTQEDIKEIIPGIEESDIKDVIAGKYSKEKVPLTKLQEDLRDIRVEQKLLNELDRVMSAEPKGEKQQREKNQKLTAIREELLKLKKDKKVDQYSEEAKVKRLIEANKKKQQEIEEKIKNKDFEEKPKPLSPYDNEEFKKKNPKLYQELIDSYTAKQDAIHEYEIEILKDEKSRMSKFKKAQEFGSKLANTTKKIVTGIDDSSLFMQTLVGTIRRPFTGAKAFKLHIQDALSKKMYERHLAELHNSPYYDLMIKSGLDITEPQSLKAKAHEEAFAGESLDITVKIKGKEYKVLNTLLSPFERAFTSLGNNMRAIAFTEYAQKLQSEGKTFENSPELYKDIANMLNTETGRGKLNEHIQKANELVTAGIWSPRLMASRLNLLGISDLVSLIPKSGSKGYYRQLTPEMRVEAIKTLGMFVATGVAISYSFAKMFGGEVDNDPKSQSFMDIKFGDKSYNIFGGFSQYVRLVAQTIAGGVTRDGKFQEFGGRKDRGANVLHFFRGKLTPVSGVVTDMMSGMKDFSGQPVTVQSEVSKLFVPLSMQSIADNMKRDGTSALLSTTLPSFVGINVKDQRDFAGASPEKVIDKGTEKILVEKGIKIPTIGNIKQYKVSTESGVMSPEDYTKFVPQVKANFNDGWDVINSEGTVTHHDGLNDMLNATYQTSEGEYIKGEDLPIEALQSKINSIFSDAQNQTKYELNLIDKNPKVTYKKAF